MSTVDPQLVARLSAVCASCVPLRFAILFGSQAVGRARPDSDVDVGIIPVDPALSLHDELALASALSAAAHAEVDLVRLDGDDPLLGREAARAAVPLFEVRPGEVSAWRARAISTWLDFDETLAPYRSRFLQRLARGA